MMEELFDLSDEYESMLARGLELSGETWDYFVRGRVAELQRALPGDFVPQRILDFGCGVGHTTNHLADCFPLANVVGADTAAPALNRARASYASSRVRFCSVDHMSEDGPFDLCYTNGVFHHIHPEQRGHALSSIQDALVSNGYFALFENNPWNLGTRLVMNRIPFDRNAHTLSPRYAVRMLEGAGWRVALVRTLFYFPHVLRQLRVAESWLGRFPFGAQYCALARPPSPNASMPAL